MNHKVRPPQTEEDNPGNQTPPPPHHDPGARVPLARIDTTTPQDSDAPGHTGKLPHERDESVTMTNQTPHPEIQQAHRDLKKGLVNTDARAADGRPLGDDVPTN
ncbi:hypothetical protein [Comamonas sp.]